MKYMLLMQFSAEGTEFPAITEWAEQDVKAHIAFMGAANEKLIADGEFVDAQGLAFPDSAKIVRASGTGGGPLVTEGPFPETKEFLAGYWIVDCESEQRAIEIAGHVSGAPGPGGEPLNMAIQVRQVMAAPPVEL
ncbi:YciI family protein [Streptomyces sp. NRRL B-24484]|uniref:YciI family protein n=1 Tax=Streptomyces sp. NRRL B-24484 TaxID=1463833 RepID=UPI0004BF0D82|nr:YciI family protein [Streptomyces sp. NRRL B-24484]